MIHVEARRLDARGVANAEDSSMTVTSDYDPSLAIRTLLQLPQSRSFRCLSSSWTKENSIRRLWNSSAQALQGVHNPSAALQGCPTHPDEGDCNPHHDGNDWPAHRKQVVDHNANG
jgi:hypothetical protein